MTTKRRFYMTALLIALVWCCPADAFAKTSASQPVSPAVVAQLRSLLPFPEASLRPKMEMNVGLDYSPDQRSQLLRESGDYASQIVAVRRKLTGGASDAAQYRSLGILYRRAGLLGKSQAAFHKSADLVSAVLRRHPDDGKALAGYGSTLAVSGQTAEAEAFLRKAAQTAPESAVAWLELGQVLGSEASPQSEAKTHRLREAAAAFDKAISLAPDNPAVWAARGNFRNWTLPAFQGKLFSRDGLSDYERVALLSPNDPYAQAMVPTIDYAFVEMEYNLPTSPEATKKETPRAVQRAKQAVRRITAIAHSTRGRRSASAYAALAWVQFQFFYDPVGAQKTLRLALRQNPHQQDAIDYQMHVAGVTGDYPLLAAACRRELRRRPQVYLRVLLAYADYYIGQQKPVYRREARTQLELAHAAQPKDYALNLGLAVLLLKYGQAADQARAALLLDRIAPQSPKRPKEQQAEYDTTRGLSLALAGDFPSARRFLARALQSDPQNRTAKSVLALLPA